MEQHYFDLLHRERGRKSDPFLISSSSSSVPSILWNDFPLPSRRVAHDSLETYFKVHMFHPWVHKQSFMGAYYLLWPTRTNNNAHFDPPDVGLGVEDCSPIIFKCALNAMLGPACAFSRSR